MNCRAAKSSVAEAVADNCQSGCETARVGTVGGDTGTGTPWLTQQDFGQWERAQAHCLASLNADAGPGPSTTNAVCVAISSRLNSMANALFMALL